MNPSVGDLCSGCGHRYGTHTIGVEGPCLEECHCPHWNALTDEEKQALIGDLQTLATELKEP